VGFVSSALTPGPSPVSSSTDLRRGRGRLACSVQVGRVDVIDADEAVEEVLPRVEEELGGFEVGVSLGVVTVAA
jgi:hypothetical protein